MLFASTGIEAHVSITPRESMAGATQKYIVQVPTESKVATVAAELEAPEGVIIEAVQMPTAWTHELKRKELRIDGVCGPSMRMTDSFEASLCRVANTGDDADMAAAVWGQVAGSLNEDVIQVPFVGFQK